MRQAVSGNTFSKVVFGLTAVLLVFVPPTARAAGAAEAIPISGFVRDILRSALPQPARGPESRLRSIR